MWVTAMKRFDCQALHALEKQMEACWGPEYLSFSYSLICHLRGYALPMHRLGNWVLQDKTSSRAYNPSKDSLIFDTTKPQCRFSFIFQVLETPRTNDTEAEVCFCRRALDLYRPMKTMLQKKLTLMQPSLCKRRRKCLEALRLTAFRTNSLRISSVNSKSLEKVSLSHDFSREDDPSLCICSLHLSFSFLKMQTNAIKRTGLSLMYVLRANQISMKTLTLAKVSTIVWPCTFIC